MTWRDLTDPVNIVGGFLVFVAVCVFIVAAFVFGGQP